MPTPSFDKTWQFSLNQSYGGGANTARAALRGIKDTMIGFALSPWTVYYSCGFNGTTQIAGSAGDLVDWWTTDISLVYGSTSSSTRSWIVLKQTGITSNFQLLIDLVTNGAGSGAHYNAEFWVSPSAGFTGGTTTARPTATDEWSSKISLQNSWTGASTTVTWRFHVMMSTDGQATHIFGAQTNIVQSIWVLDKPKGVRAGITNPAVAMVLGIGNTSSQMATYGNLYDLVNPSAGVDTRSSTASFTCESCNGDAVGQQATVADDIDGSWPIMPMGVFAFSGKMRGRLGQIYDLWWGSTGVALGDDYDETANKVLCQVGHLIVPSNGLTLSFT